MGKRHGVCVCRAGGELALTPLAMAACFGPSFLTLALYSLLLPLDRVPNTQTFHPHSHPSSWELSARVSARELTTSPPKNPC